MQLGTRWQAGEIPPSSVPHLLTTAIAEVENDVTQIQGRATLESLFWTLTWLENRPICRLDSGDELTVSSGGMVVRTTSDDISQAEEDDDWLS